LVNNAEITLTDENRLVVKSHIDKASIQPEIKALISATIDELPENFSRTILEELIPLDLKPVVAAFLQSLSGGDHANALTYLNPDRHAVYTLAVGALRVRWRLKGYLK